MKLDHPNIISSFFKLIGVYELDILFISGDDEDRIPLRIELFQSLSNKTLFRYKAWQSEFFRIQSTFPRDESGINPLHSPSDEIILVQFGQKHFQGGDDFYAISPDEALDKIITDLSKALEHITRIPITIRKSEDEKTT